MVFAGKAWERAETTKGPEPHPQDDVTGGPKVLHDQNI